MSKQVNGNEDTSRKTDVETDTTVLHFEENGDTADTRLQTDMDEAINPAAPPDNAELLQPNSLTEINQKLAALQDLFDKQIARNQNQTEMFDKMYAEMKEYKEQFLLEVLHKPIIHNLLQLYDSFVALETQLNEIIADNETNILSEELARYRKNLENFRFELEEVLYRMDVTPYKEALQTLDRQLHKTRQVISSDDPKQDGHIAEVHKIGFNWRNKVFRPEEVTIFRYTPATGKPPLGEKGGKTDG